MILGFRRHQYSDYRADQIFGAQAWISAITLKFINPPMKLETTILGLKVHYYDNLHLLDLTMNIRIGGALSTILEGPIPEFLFPENPAFEVLGIHGGPPVHPNPNNFQRPKYVRQSPNSTNPANYLT